MKTRWIIILVILPIGGVAIWRFTRPQPAPVAATGPARGTPVVLAAAAERDVPVWLSGLGTVQAFNTVTVRPRVTGTLDSVKFDEGQSVKAGDVLAQIDPRPYRSLLQQTQAKLAQDQAQLENARRELTRIRELVEGEAESQRLLDQQEASVAQLAALVQADQSAVAAAQLDLDFTTVRAPIDGRTGVRMVDAGNIVTASQAGGLVVITQLQPLSVLFTLPQQYLPAFRAHIRPDSPKLAAQALTDDGSVLDEGKLELIDNQIDATTGTIRLKATFANEQFALWPGQFVSARVLVETREKAVVVPAEVVQAGIDGPFAYVVKTDDTVEARSIKAGLTVDGMTIIESGLAVGEKVVRDGQSKLKPGSLVAARKETP